MGLKTRKGFTTGEFLRPSGSDCGHARISSGNAVVGKWTRQARGAPAARKRVHRENMSIEKESTGLPEVNVHKRTTKVNLSIVIGVMVFFAAMAGVVWWFWSNNP